MAAVRQLVPRPAEEHVAVLQEWDRFARIVMSEQPLVVVVDTELCDSDPDEFVRVREGAQGASWIAAVRPTPESAIAGLKLVRAGGEAVWSVGATSAESVELEKVIVAALARRVTRLVLESFTSDIPLELRAFLERLWAGCARPLRPSDAASLYHGHVSTLQRHLHHVGLPPPGKLIVWGRLFHAAHLLGGAGRTVDSVASLLGFPSADALRNQLRRYADLTPTALKQDGLRILTAEFIERCEDRRSSLHPSKVS